MGATSIQEEKEMIRQATYKALNRLGEKRIREESSIIQAHVRSLIDKLVAERDVSTKTAVRPLRVAVYHAMPLEVDLHELVIDPRLNSAVEFYLPRSIRDEGDLALAFAKWPLGVTDRLPEAWVTAWYGAVEPPAEQASREIEFDLIFLPCVAVSAYGERIGHGKGYYDRFLSTQTPSTRLYALCLSPQAVEGHLPVEAHDQLLDGRITAANGIEERLGAY